MASEPPLFGAFPRLSGRLPWVALGDFPTPLERLDGLLPPSVELWVKREDRSAALYGGNKVRKLEFILAEAEARGMTRLATLGGYGSHHVLATALFGRSRGFAVSALVFPQPLTAHVEAQLARDIDAGCALTKLDGLWQVPQAAWAEQTRADTLWIPGGGSSVTGTLGWVSAGYELLAQTPRPDVIYVALGSNGTAAGLLASLGGEIEIVAVRVVDRAVANGFAVRALASATLDRLAALDPRSARPQRSPRLRIEHGFFGGAYGRPTPEADAAVREAARVGLRLETTYTGKVLAALLADARAGRLDGKRVLFIDTFSSV